MPTIHIPPLLRRLSGGNAALDVPGRTLGEALDALEARFPGLRAELVEGVQVRPNLAVVVDGEVVEGRLGLPVGPASEIHFLPPMSGGSVV